jgi:hypothetical protein
MADVRDKITTLDKIIEYDDKMDITLESINISDAYNNASDTTKSNISISFKNYNASQIETDACNIALQNAVSIYDCAITDVNASKATYHEANKVVHDIKNKLDTGIYKDDDSCMAEVNDAVTALNVAKDNCVNAINALNIADNDTNNASDKYITSRAKSTVHWGLIINCLQNTSS